MKFRVTDRAVELYLQHCEVVGELNCAEDVQLVALDDRSQRIILNRETDSYYQLDVPNFRIEDAERFLARMKLESDIAYFLGMAKPELSGDCDD